MYHCDKGFHNKGSASPERNRPVDNVVCIVSERQIILIAIIWQQLGQSLEN